MYKVTKHILFCYGHRLLNYDGKCKHLHGHNGHVEIELTAASLDRRGMVMDFEEIKTAIKTWIDDALDHKMLLCKDDPLVKVLKELKEPCYLMDHNPTAENIARLIFDHAADKGFPVSEVKLWETETSHAVYRPDAEQGA
jgi:6-pyruvoyltetrahydropterin/6-carboxytetrahydropterin synthase